MAQLRACSVMERAERLKCLDNLSRNIAPAVGPAPADNWIVSETTSPVDYTPIVTASTSSRGPDSSSMQLSIYCRSGRTEMVVTGSALSGRGGDYAITYSINDNQPVQVAAGSPSFGTGVAFKATWCVCCSRSRTKAKSPFTSRPEPPLPLSDLSRSAD